VRVLGGTSYAATPAGARALASHDSMTLTQLLTPFLKLEQQHARRTPGQSMGEKVRGEGTWDATTAVLDDAATMGVDTSAVAWSTAPGSPARDLLTPQQITNLLIAARASPGSPAWYNALPIAATRTVHRRHAAAIALRNTPAANNLHGKKGSMTAVSALSDTSRTRRRSASVFLDDQHNFLPAASRPIGPASAFPLRRAPSRPEPT